jgi:hypothetical protein
MGEGPRASGVHAIRIPAQPAHRTGSSTSASGETSRPGAPRDSDRRFLGHRNLGEILDRMSLVCRDSCRPANERTNANQDFRLANHGLQSWRRPLHRVCRRIAPARGANPGTIVFHETNGGTCRHRCCLVRGARVSPQPIRSRRKGDRPSVEKRARDRRRREAGSAAGRRLRVEFVRHGRLRPCGRQLRRGCDDRLRSTGRERREIDVERGRSVRAETPSLSTSEAPLPVLAPQASASSLLA